MSVGFDPSTDFQTITDGLASVTLRARDASETTVAKSLRRAITQREADKSDGKYTTNDVAFHLPIALVATQPELGSEIVDSQGDWRVLEVARQTLSARWRCICRDLAITEELNTLVTIQQATYAKGSTGALEPTWSNQHTNRRAKVQLISADRDTDHEHQQIIREARVYFAEQLLLTTNHRIIGPDSAIYKVFGWDEPDSISGLFTARCEVTQWPHD